MDPVFSHAAIGSVIVTVAMMIAVYILRLVFGHLMETYRSRGQS